MEYKTAPFPPSRQDCSSVIFSLVTSRPSSSPATFLTDSVRIRTSWKEKPRQSRLRYSLYDGLKNCKLPDMESFKNDTVVRVAGEEVKRVEDILTDDFIRASNNSHDTSVDMAELRHITRVHETNTAGLRFIHGDTDVTLVCQLDQPFYRFCTGWSSLFPLLTKAKYGLTCKTLSIGDICMVLRPRQRRRKKEIETSYPSSRARITQLNKNCSIVKKDRKYSYVTYEDDEEDMTYEDDEQPTDLTIKKTVDSLNKCKQ
eukprot:GFUD01040779.1.p1 GENE.GFUD01040779.1~~GFUD01040779.1.p1  ORF type:complete len:258 (+),score=75.83 GFUD01040779.1:45-818(+)